MSKEVKPKQRIGRKPPSTRKKVVLWAVALVVFGGAGYAAYYYGGRTVVEVPVAKVRRGDFVRAIRARGEVKSTRSYQLAAPQVPNLRITTLAKSGQLVRRGDVVVEFDDASQVQAETERTIALRTAESQIVQTKASHKMTNESDRMSLLQGHYSLERARLEASKAEIVSEIQGAKSRIDVGITEGDLNLTKVTVNAHQVSQQTEMQRLNTSLEKAKRDLERTREYLSKMTLRAPADGIVNILSNFRSGGSFGQADPPFKEGDSVWFGAVIAEIPDLSSMRVEVKLDEVDRGNAKLGQKVKVRVDAIPDKEFDAVLDWISPIAALAFRGQRDADKQFPAYATLASVDPRLRPGMSASVDIIVESIPDTLLIPIRASFTQAGKPAAYIQEGDQFRLRPIEVGARNESDMVVLRGLREGEVVTLENPVEAARRAKKRL